MAIAGIISKKDENIADTMAKMLIAMTHAENSFADLALDKEIISIEAVKSHDLKDAEASTAIGCCGYPIEKEEFTIRALKEENENIFLVGVGRTYFDQTKEPIKSSSATWNVETITHIIEEDHHNLFKTILNIFPRLHGFFSFAILRKEEVIVARDVIGAEPLYWGENEDCYAFASERKALWRIGINDVTAFPPGHIASISKSGCTLSKALTLRKSRIADISLDAAAQELKNILQQVFKMYLGELSEVGVFFSGGIDSSLVAKIAGDMGLKVTLYTAGVEGSHDIDVAEKSADELGYNHYTCSIPLSRVEEYIPKIIYATEEEKLMNATVGIPLYAAAELASIQDSRIILSGEGSDELFGGYTKYQRILQKYDHKRLNEELWRDILQMSEVNLQRDSAIAIANNIELLPLYMDLRVIKLAMSFPTQFKVIDSMDMMRKHVLRKTAKLINLPDHIVNLPKKAAQYGSGADKALKMLAKMKGYKHPLEYVNATFREVFRDRTA